MLALLWSLRSQKSKCALSLPPSRFYMKCLLPAGEKSKSPYEGEASMEEHAQAAAIDKCQNNMLRKPV